MQDVLDFIIITVIIVSIRQEVGACQPFCVCVPQKQTIPKTIVVVTKKEIHNDGEEKNIYFSIIRLKKKKREESVMNDARHLVTFSRKKDLTSIRNFLSWEKGKKKMMMMRIISVLKSHQEPSYNREGGAICELRCQGDRGARALTTHHKIRGESLWDYDCLTYYSYIKSTLFGPYINSGRISNSRWLN